MEFQESDQLKEIECEEFSIDWRYWLSMFTLNLFQAIELSLGICPTTRKGSSQIKALELSKRFDILESHIGENGHRFYFGDIARFSKVHAAIKPIDFLGFMNDMSWDYPEEWQQYLNAKPTTQRHPDDPITTLQAIGIMAELLAAENGYTYRRGENVNAKAIGTAVANRAKARFGHDVRGFESFNKKISEGLKALEDLEKK